MTKIIDIINEKLDSELIDIISEQLDSELFSKSYNKPHIAGWIKRNHELGHYSKNDYIKIVKWVEDKNPNLENYDFRSALALADAYVKSLKKNNFSDSADIKFNNLIFKFDNGKEWHSFGSKDCNGIIHKLAYDCSSELRQVYSGSNEAYVLIDDQENVLCIAINDGKGLSIIGKLGNDPINCHNEIHYLCVRKGMPLNINSFSYDELVDAIKSKVINVDDNVKDIMKRLKPQDVVDCKLLRYCHFCNLSNMLSIYLKCGQDCIVKYIMASLVYYGLTKSALYGTVKQIINDRNLGKDFAIDSSDSRPYLDLIDKYQSEIIKL